MKKHFTSSLLALIGGASINCAPAKQVENPKQYDCSLINLQDKVGFSVQVGTEKKVCYSIQSTAVQSYEYIGFCEPTEKTVEFYRNFAGLNKGGMEMNYISNFLGILAYIPFSRTSSGDITISSLMEMPREEVEQIFQKGARLLDSTRNSPEVCRKLQDYKNNKASKH